MRRMKQLQELFDSPVPYEKDSEDGWTFTVNDIEYAVVFDREIFFFRELIEQVPDLRIWFESLTSRQVNRVIDNSGELAFMVNDLDMIIGGKSMSILDTGNQFTVFSTVLDILMREIMPKPDSPPLLWFSAKEPSRAKLYHTFSKNIQKKVSDLEFIGFPVVYDHKEFFIFKNNSKIASV